MESLFTNYNLNKFKIKKPRKDEERVKYIELLSEKTGWSKRGLAFSFKGLPDSWLRDALKYCENYSTQSTRSWKLKEFLKNTNEND